MMQDTSDMKHRVTDMVGSANECVAHVDHIPARTLLDTESMITCISSSFVNTHLGSLPKFPVAHILCVKGPMDDTLPYHDFIEVEIELPVNGVNHTIGTFPVLISPDTNFNIDVPLLIGTNVLDRFYEQLNEQYGKLPLEQVSKSIRVALQTISLRNRHLEKRCGVYGLVKASESLSVEPGQSVVVSCNTQVAIPIIRSMAMVQSCHGGTYPSLF